VPISSARTWAVVPAAIALLAIALKAVQWYFARPLWLDEEMLLLNVRDRGFSELPGPLWLNQTAPLGWLVLERAVITAFGLADRTVRALPVAFGVGTVATAAWFAIRRLGPAGATVFVAVCGFGQWITFYALEAKPYSSDVFWALLLPVVAIWVVESEQPSPVFAKRALLWWVLAAIGQWVGYGALFVTPGCAAILCLTAWMRGRWRLFFFITSPAIIWLLSLALHYDATISYANNSSYLRQYWWWAFPPETRGLGSTLQWLSLQLKPLALHPAGTSQWLELWLLSIYALVVSIRTRLAFALVVISVPLSAFALAALRVVPLADRLAVWVVPSLYLAMAIATDDALNRMRRGFAKREWANAIVGVVVAVIVGRLCVDVLERGYRNITVFQRSNHELDDRAGLRLLTAQHQFKDAFLTTHLGLPAVWWYAPVTIADPTAGRINPADGAPVFEVRLVQSGGDACRTSDQTSELKQATKGMRRVLVYLGFESRNPMGLQELILDKLSELGRMTSFRRVADHGLSAVFDLTQRPESWAVILPNPSTSLPAASVTRPSGCIGIRQANRW
jgi:hypothetical protein